MKKYMLGSDGFSLVQGLILSAVLAGSALVATQLLQDQKKTQKAAETRDQIEQLHKIIYSVLQNRDHCSRTIIDAGIQNSLTTANGNPTLNQIRTVVSRTTNASGTTYATSPFAEINPAAVNPSAPIDNSKTYMQNSVMIKSMQFQNPIPAPDTKAGVARLRITYQRLNQNANARTKQGYGAKEITKNIYIRIQRSVDSTPANKWDNPFDGCYALTASDTVDQGNEDLAERMCTNLNAHDASSTNKSLFVWDADLGACLPKDLSCQGAGQVNTGINSNGEAECRTLEGWTDLNKYIDNNSPTSCAAGRRASLVMSGNRVRIVCTP